eukprot:2244556-Rhodomonas_salina.1
MGRSAYSLNAHSVSMLESKDLFSQPTSYLSTADCTSRNTDSEHRQDSHTLSMDTFEFIFRLGQPLYHDSPQPHALMVTDRAGHGTARSARVRGRT